MYDAGVSEPRALSDFNPRATRDGSQDKNYFYSTAGVKTCVMWKHFCNSSRFNKFPFITQIEYFRVRPKTLRTQQNTGAENNSYILIVVGMHHGMVKNFCHASCVKFIGRGEEAKLSIDLDQISFTFEEI